MEFLTWLQEQCYQTFIEDDRWRIYFLKGLGTTFKITIGALILGVIIGIIIAVVRSAYDSQRRHWHGVGGILLGLGNLLCKLYLTVLRGTPVLVQIYIIYQALAVMGLNLSNLASGIIALSLNSGGFIAEIIRGGLTAVPKGQTEAARALGMSEPKILMRIVFPQVFKVALPQLTSEFINVIKVSPMLSVLAIVELTRTAQRLVTQTYINLPFYIAIAVMYFVICAGLEELVKLQKKRLERR